MQVRDVPILPVHRPPQLPRARKRPIKITIPEAPGPAHKHKRFRPSPFLVLVRVFVWWRFLFRFVFGNVIDGIRRKGSKQIQAERLRTLLQELGPSGIKVGQQLAVRVDLFPKEYIDELGSLLEDVAPISLEEARQVLDANLEGALEDHFAEFLFEPIGSGSLACVYRARLKNGRLVAVKVRRPGIAARFAADMTALKWMFGVLEGIGTVRPGLVLPVVHELDRMLMDELDFLLEARQLESFRRDIKQQKHVSAPKVFHRFNTGELLVTEFVEGYSVQEILNIVESRDTQRLGALQELGFDPVKISRRWLRFFYWESYESVVFHADPHPGNLIVKPGNKIILIDFGCCGSVSKNHRVNMRGFQDCMSRRDLDGMARHVVRMAEPLPPLDIHAYMADMRNVMREFYILSRCEYLPWQDRAYGRGLQLMMEVTRAYNVGMQPDTLRFFRASNLSDAMIYRLDPNLDPNREYEKWVKARLKQQQKKLLKKQQKEQQKKHRKEQHSEVEEEDTTASNPSDLNERLTRLETWHQARELKAREREGERPPRYRQNSGKGTYALALILRNLLRAGLLLAVFAFALDLWDRGWKAIVEASLESMSSQLMYLLGQPWLLLIGGLWLVIVVRKMIGRFEEIEIN